MASRAVPILFALLACGCEQRQPSIQFSKLPPAGLGDPVRLDPIEGTVRGAKTGQKIVLYAKSGVWWIQPLANAPFTSVKSDSTWQNTTHPGTEYAALLVDSGYVPPTKLQELPGVAGAVRAIAVQKGDGSGGSVAPRIVHFSGYDWEVRHQPSERGGRLNPYDPGNVWTDAQGWLHLRTRKQGVAWAGAEVQLTHSLGHGSYRFTVRDVAGIDTATALTLYTRDEAAIEQNNREIDIEISRWGDPTGKNAQFVVPPFNEPANVVRFEAPAGPLTYSFRWLPGSVFFQAVRGGSVVAEHEFNASVPTPGGESARMNLYVYGGSRVPAQGASEVVIEKFEFLP